LYGSIHLQKHTFTEGVPVLSSDKGIWDHIFHMDDEGDSEESEGDVPDDSLGLDETDGEGAIFLQEAHEALKRLSQKTNKRSRVLKHVRRTEGWD
jgi:hypothetical protein